MDGSANEPSFGARPGDAIVQEVRGGQAKERVLESLPFHDDGHGVFRHTTVVFIALKEQH